MASGARKRSPTGGGDGAADDEARSGAGRRRRAGRARRRAGRRRGRRSGGPAAAGADARTGRPRPEIRATARAGHQAAATAVTNGQDHGRGDRPPRAGRTGRCGARRSTRSVGTNANHAGQPDGGADDRGGGADGGAVGQHDQPDVAVGRAERAEHAQGPQAALGHHGEPGDRHQADEEQPERAEDEHDGLGGGLVAGRRGDSMPRPVPLGSRNDWRLCWLALTQDRDAGRRVGLARGRPGRTGRAGPAGSRPCRRPAGSGRLRCQALPTCRSKVLATSLVTATSSGPVG